MQKSLPLNSYRNKHDFNPIHPSISFIKAKGVNTKLISRSESGVNEVIINRLASDNKEPS